MIETEIHKLLNEADVCYEGRVVQGVRILINRVAERDAWLAAGVEREGRLRDIIERVRGMLDEAGISCPTGADVVDGVRLLITKARNRSVILARTCACARLPRPHDFIPSACTGDRPQ